LHGDHTWKCISVILDVVIILGLVIILGSAVILGVVIILGLVVVIIPHSNILHGPEFVEPGFIISEGTCSRTSRQALE